MFDNFVSLGFFCGVAASLSKYGLRNKSYPFDWYHSDFKGVLHFIDKDFSDFLLRENLRVVSREKSGGGVWFEDIKYNMCYSHDLRDENNFELEYPVIYEKYMRRIERFRKDIQNPTCFLRAVWTEAELQYITNNPDYIKQVIKRGNAFNEIVFLIPPSLVVKSNLAFSYFNIKRWGSDTPKELRGMFDGNEDLIGYLLSNTTVSKVVSNLMWDREAEIDKIQRKNIYVEHENKILQSRYNLLLKLTRCELDMARIPDSIAIYGAGNIGRAFYEKCKGLCRVRYFVDGSSGEKEYKGIPIVSLKELEDKGDMCENYVITPTYDFETIREWFSEHCPNAGLFSLDTLFAEY